MKKIMVLSVIMTFVVLFAAPLYASELPRPLDKLGHGLVDIVTSPLEIYHHTSDKVNSEDQKVLGFFKGLVESPFYMIKKLGGGVVDVLTFPIE